jgi:hypothetical protein
MAFITTSMVVLGDKLGGGHVDQSAGVLRIVSGAPFLRSSRVCPTLVMVSERLPRTWTVHIKRTCGIRGLAQEAYMSSVSGFPL